MNAARFALAPLCGWTLAYLQPNSCLARSIASVLDLVVKPAPAVIPAPGIPLGVLVRQHRPRRLHARRPRRGSRWRSAPASSPAAAAPGRSARRSSGRSAADSCHRLRRHWTDHSHNGARIVAGARVPNQRQPIIGRTLTAGPTLTTHKIIPPCRTPERPRTAPRVGNCR